MTLAYHWISAGRRLGYGDGRRVRAGQTYTMRPVTDASGVTYTEPTLCRAGMHGSTRILDALSYARGPVLCRVCITGDVVRGEDKIAGRRRSVVWILDCERILHEFACWCAERALRRAGVADERSWAAISTKRAWLRGEASDADMDALDVGTDLGCAVVVAIDAIPVHHQDMSVGSVGVEYLFGPLPALQPLGVQPLLRI